MKSEIQLINLRVSSIISIDQYRFLILTVSLNLFSWIHSYFLNNNHFPFVHIIALHETLSYIMCLINVYF
jgi:hypothetical protein